MSTNLILGCLAACVSVSVPLSLALVRANTRARNLQHHLTNVFASKLEHDSRHAAINKVKDDFICNLSHELRTPLTAIHGALGLLSARLMGTIDEKDQNLLRIATRNTDRLIRLINQILDLERLESGCDPLILNDCSLRGLTEQAVDLMSSTAESAAVKVLLIPAAPPEVVLTGRASTFNGDPDRIVQVLTSLLSNSIKFSDPGGVIELHIGSDAESVLLRVSDYGRGIPDDKLDAIFGRFQQVESADARQKDGIGLGLAICRTIIHQHGGSIWAESNSHIGRGPGTSFFVSLPRKRHPRDLANTLSANLPVAAARQSLR